MVIKGMENSDFEIQQKKYVEGENDKVDNSEELRSNEDKENKKNSSGCVSFLLNFLNFLACIGLLVYIKLIWWFIDEVIYGPTHDNYALLVLLPMIAACLIFLFIIFLLKIIIKIIKGQKVTVDIIIFMILILISLILLL